MRDIYLPTLILSKSNHENIGQYIPEDRSLLMYQFSKVDEIRILFLYGTI